MRASLIGSVLAAAIAVAPHVALAGHQRFEPTDLELEDTGTLDIDLQTGLLYSDSLKYIGPDVEIDLGVAPNMEIDLDTAYSISSPGFGHHLRSQAGFDDTWLSVKLGLWSTRNDRDDTSLGIGAQFGPKIPTSGASGVGYEALLLIARRIHWTHLVFDVGGLIDPGGAVGSDRPIGVEMGVDFTQQLDADGTFSILGELGAVIYATSDPDQLEVTAGLQWEPFDALDLSIIGLAGIPPGSDGFGALFGFSPKFKLW